MTMRLFRLLLILGVMAAPAAAQQRPYVGRSGDFAARLILVDDLDGFWRIWRGPPPPRFRESNTVTRAKPAHALLLFTGCKARSSGRCDVAVTFSIIGPDKRPYGKPVSGSAYSGAPAPGTALIASPAALTMKLEPNDKPGPYLIQAVVTDRVAGRTVTLRRGVLAGVPRKPTV